MKKYKDEKTINIKFCFANLTLFYMYIFRWQKPYVFNDVIKPYSKELDIYYIYITFQTFLPLYKFSNKDRFYVKDKKHHFYLTFPSNLNLKISNIYTIYWRKFNKKGFILMRLQVNIFGCKEVKLFLTDETGRDFYYALFWSIFISIDSPSMKTQNLTIISISLNTIDAYTCI